MQEVKNMVLYHFSDNILDNNSLLVISNSYYSLISHMAKKEIILESVRKELFKDYISRYHALYCCDKESVRYWKRNLYNPYLYLLELNGIIFSSHAKYIPFDNDSYDDLIDKAICYWSNQKSSNEDREYLFQGEAKVLKRLI